MKRFRMYYTGRARAAEDPTGGWVEYADAKMEVCEANERASKWQRIASLTAENWRSAMQLIDTFVAREKTGQKMIKERDAHITSLKAALVHSESCVVQGMARIAELETELAAYRKNKSSRK